MIRVVLVSVGRARLRPIRAAIRDYEDRLARYVRFEAHEVDPAGLPDDRADEAREAEAVALERRIPEDLDRVALTREGRSWSTRDLADYIGDMQTYARPGAVFLIGGAHGLADRLIQGATRRLSLSAMTLPHEVARLVLVEQLYRAGTILRGEPYHKGR